MKKVGFMIFAALFLTTFSFLSVVCAEEAQPAMRERDPMKMVQMGKMQKMQTPAGPMMMKRMMQPTVVATPDGGVIVVVGNQMTKYDSELNVVKEVEIKIDMEKMQNNMMGMMKQCPLMKGKQQMASSEPAPAPEMLPPPTKPEVPGEIAAEVSEKPAEVAE